jgi:uncharacterized protein YijF (DUF1287 family)
MNRRALLISLLASPAFAQSPSDFGQRLAAAAMGQVGVTRIYDPAYRRLAYPGGDVPADRGVCTDVIARAYRVLGYDLQKLVYEDMGANFSAYPNLWGLTRADSNIDHRRVPNLEKFFARAGARLPASKNSEDYAPGDLVSWRLNGSGLAHIGMVAPRRTRAGTPLIIHNIGAGAQIEDILFQHRIVDRFRWRPT